MIYCEKCDQQIDTDYDAEHFDECGTKSLLQELKESLEDLHKPFAGYIEVERKLEVKCMCHD